jgi:predicted nucleic acid-binding protein
MKTYVLDASAVIRYLSNGAGVEKVNKLIQRAVKGEVQLFISVINWGEALYSLAQKAGLDKATADLKMMSAFVVPVDVREAQAESAAIVRLHYKLGYADCFAAALAIRMNATLVTTDLDFGKLGKKLKVLALSRGVE